MSAYLFTFSTINSFSFQIKPSLVSQCLTRTFEKSDVFSGIKNCYQDVSSSSIQFSVIAELVCLRSEDLNSVALCCAKDSVDVSIGFMSNSSQ